MIECKIEEPALDITPELALSAYNVIREYAAGKKNCKECIFYRKCGKSFTFCPEEWPKMKNP